MYQLVRIDQIAMIHLDANKMDIVAIKNEFCTFYAAFI